MQHVLCFLRCLANETSKRQQAAIHSEWGNLTYHSSEAAGQDAWKAWSVQNLTRSRARWCPSASSSRRQTRCSAWALLEFYIWQDSCCRLRAHINSSGTQSMLGEPGRPANPVLTQSCTTTITTICPTPTSQRTQDRMAQPCSAMQSTKDPCIRDVVSRSRRSSPAHLLRWMWRHRATSAEPSRS